MNTIPFQIEDNPCVPVMDAGPVVEWWVTGFDGGDRHIVGISTAVADYYLNEPSETYAPFMVDLNRKAWITKVGN